MTGRGSQSTRGAENCHPAIDNRRRAADDHDWSDHSTTSRKRIMFGPCSWDFGPFYAEGSSEPAFTGRGAGRPDAELARRTLRCDELLVIQQYPMMPSHVYTYHVEGLRAGGGLYRLPPAARRPAGQAAATGRRRRNGEILDCELSFDGRTVLFAWKRSMPEPYHLFTIPVRGRPACGSSPPASITTTTPAGCPTAASPSCPPATRSSPTAGTRRWACCTAWTPTAANVRRLSAPTT